MASQAERRHDTRRRILSAAGKLFKVHGFEGTSVDQIVAAANLAKGTFYQYFQTKIDVALALTSKFSWSLLSEIVGAAAFAAPTAVGYQVPPGAEVVRRFHGRGFFDLTMMQWAFYDALGILPADVVKALGGQQPEISVPSQPPLKGRPNGPRRQRATLGLLRRIWNYPSKAKPLIKSHLEYVRSFEATDWTTFSRDSLQQTMTHIKEALTIWAMAPAFRPRNKSALPALRRSRATAAG
jgi:pyruvate,water dikinase